MSPENQKPLSFRILSKCTNMKFQVTFHSMQDAVCKSQLVDATTRLNQAAAYTCKQQGVKLELPVFRSLGVWVCIFIQAVRVYCVEQRAESHVFRPFSEAGLETFLNSGHLI